TRMLDGVEPEVMDEIEHSVRHVAEVASVSAVRARWIGHRLQAEVHVAVAPELTVAEGHAIAQRVQAELEEHLPALSFVSVHVDPTSEAGDAAHREHHHD